MKVFDAYDAGTVDRATFVGKVWYTLSTLFDSGYHSEYVVGVASGDDDDEIEFETDMDIDDLLDAEETDDDTPPDPF